MSMITRYNLKNVVVRELCLSYNVLVSLNICRAVLSFRAIRKDPSHTSPIQSTLVISKSKGPSKTLRDIRISTYQICSTEEKTI